MNLLMDAPPTHVKVANEKIPIKTDYRIGIRFELLMSDPMISDVDKLKRAFGLFYGKHFFRTEQLDEAVDAILWFYTCGKDIDDLKTKKDSKKAPSGANRVYDYAYDADYIYAAFLQQYGTDLTQNRIHWWKFKAMFKALTDKTEFVKIMGYRSIKINSNMTKSQKEFYQEMKRIHALPLPKSERQKLAAIEEALLNGGDLKGLIGNAPG